MPSTQCYYISIDDDDDDDDDDGGGEDHDENNLPYKAIWPLVHVLGLIYI